MLQYSIDEVNSERVRGWAFDPEGEAEISIAVDDRPVGSIRPSAYRIDVAHALGNPAAAHSGFEFHLDRAAFDGSHEDRAEISVRVGSIEAARCAVPILSDPQAPVVPGPFPPEVLALLGAYRSRYLSIDAWDDASATEAVSDLAFLLQRGPRAMPGLHQYLVRIAQLWVRATFAEQFFPRENAMAALDDKDRSAIQNSALEVFAIAVHLVTLDAHGVEGAFAEFGCFKGFSTAILSDACHQLGREMHVFDSFEGLPPSDSQYYRAGEFAGSLPEVRANVATYGSPRPVQFHQGFFADTLARIDTPPLMSLWMDVDLESSATDVMAVLPRLDRRGVLFSHECPPEMFEAGTAAASRNPDQVIPPILDAFAARGRTVATRHVAGNTGAFWDAEHGIAPLPTAALLALRDIAISVVAPSPAAPQAAPGTGAPEPRRRRRTRRS